MLKQLFKDQLFLTQEEGKGTQILQKTHSGLMATCMCGGCESHVYLCFHQLQGGLASPRQVAGALASTGGWGPRTFGTTLRAFWNLKVQGSCFQVSGGMQSSYPTILMY